jgi:hypothetical protein
VATSDGWEAAFVAMSVAIGIGPDEACVSLDEEAAGRVRGFVDAVASDSREARAKALAAGLARIALAVEKVRLA